MKYSTCQDIRMLQLSAYTARANKIFRAHNVGGMLGISGVQYSASCEANLFGTSRTHARLVDKYIAISLSVAHTALYFSAEPQNDRMTNGITCK